MVTSAVGVSGANNCYFYVWAASPAPTVYLAADAGGWVGSAPVQQPGASLQNSSCILDLANSSASFVGNTLNLTLRITFKPAYAGTYTQWMWSGDWQSNGPGWESKGTWTVPPAGNPAPQLTSLTPNTGSGLGPTNFQFVVTDPQGANNVKQIQMVAGAQLTSVQSCFGYIWVDAAVIYLADNTGNLVYPGSSGLLGSLGVLQNSQCKINLGSSSQVKSGNTVTVTLSVEFFSAYGSTTPRTWYGWADDWNGNGSNWAAMGTWTIPVGSSSNVPPAPIPVAISASGASTAFTFGYTDGNGASDITQASVRINATASSAAACQFRYEKQPELLRLFDDLGAGSTTAAFVSGSSVQNSQCIVSVQSKQVLGQTLQYSIAAQAKPSWTGTKSIWQAAVDTAGADSGWASSGTWQAQGSGGAMYAAVERNYLLNNNVEAIFTGSKSASEPTSFSLLTYCSLIGPDALHPIDVVPGVTLSNMTTTATQVQLRIRVDYTARPTSTPRMWCTGTGAGNFYSDAIPIFDATPTILSTNPQPLELDTNSQRTFTINGYGFGRAIPVILINPSNSGLTVASYAQTSGGPPSPYAQFNLTLQAGATAGNYTIRLVSIGSGSNGFFASPDNNSATSLSYAVAVRAPQFRLSLFGQPVTNGQTSWLVADDPTTPFRASLTTMNTSGSFSLRAVSSYRDISDTDSISPIGTGPFVQSEERQQPCPISVGGQPLECEFQGLVTGGSVRLEWKLQSQTAWNSGPSVIVKGFSGPSRAQFENYATVNLQDNPWFLKWLPFGEDQNSENRWSQFKDSGSGNPKWGPPHGYGVLQIDPPWGSNRDRPPISTMFNWRVNVDLAHTLLWVDKKPALDTYWRAEVQQWRDYNLANPDSPAGPPDHDEANCSFRFYVSGPDQQNRIFSIEDALWIKSYNGNSGSGSGRYAEWAENQGQWRFNVLNGYAQPFNYVNRVCSGVQPQP